MMFRLAGAKQAIFGTNPICVSVPAAGGPVTMDMATAAYAWFGVLEAKTAGAQLPTGVAMDSDGHDTTDPNAVLSGGALKVFDGSYKGSALALFVELLAGPLVGAAVADKMEEKSWGNLMIAIDPSLLQVWRRRCSGPLYLIRVLTSEQYQYANVERHLQVAHALALLNVCAFFVNPMRSHGC